MSGSLKKDSMQPEFSSLLESLPDDVLASISQSLSPRDLCNLCLCCRSLCVLVASEKVWLAQCDKVGIVANRELVEWRKGVSSYKALCRFLLSVKPLIGIWVHQNPELGNVVYVMPGFLSVVGCRIIPQELGPLGIEDGPILWAPVFEIIADFDGSTAFFLHGREKRDDCIYPGTVKALEKDCNLLLLEVEPRQQRNVRGLLDSMSLPNNLEKELPTKISRADSLMRRSERVVIQSEVNVPFSRLAFDDRKRLIEFVTSKVHHKVSHSENAPLFLCLRIDEENCRKDMKLLFARRSMLLEKYKPSVTNTICKKDELPFDHNQLQLSDVRNSLIPPSGFPYSQNGDDSHTRSVAKKMLGGYFRACLRQILGKSSPSNGSHVLLKSSSSSSESKHACLHDFLRYSDTIGLTLHASKVRLSSYRAWPNMQDSRFALYKLPIRAPKVGQEYAGLWGGTFGWPPGKPSEEKPGKALFFLLISYEESEGQRHVVATKILEGTHYVLHPNGSAMFMVNTDEHSQDPFPWDADAGLGPVNVEHAFTGEGIANGYGFRYPGSKPGTLFVIQNGLLAFVWKESRAVLTMQRLNLQELLKKGERVPPLPPIANFSYLTESYSNVFTGLSNASTFLSEPRLSDL